MDYLSNLRDVKSVIASILRDHLCVQGSNMKYTKLGDEADSQESLNNDLLADMLEEEKLKCELDTFHTWSLSDDSESSAGSVTSASDKGNNSTCTSSNAWSEHSSVDEVPTRLVITYHFSFDTEEDVDNVSENVHGSEQDNVLDDSFGSDEEMGLMEYSSVINGSKNNLLDESLRGNLCNGIENACIENNDSDPELSNSTMDADADSDATFDCLENVELDDTDIGAFETDNVSKYCGNPSTPSMRKGFIYYSSEVRLYQGELCYDESYPEKKFNFAKKLFKKVFPSQKYVVNM